MASLVVATVRFAFFSLVFVATVAFNCFFATVGCPRSQFVFIATVGCPRTSDGGLVATVVFYQCSSQL